MEREIDFVLRILYWRRGGKGGVCIEWMVWYEWYEWEGGERVCFGGGGGGCDYRATCSSFSSYLQRFLTGCAG